MQAGVDVVARTEAHGAHIVLSTVEVFEVLVHMDPVMNEASALPCPRARRQRLTRQAIELDETRSSYLLQESHSDEWAPGRL
jgi:hypothetical protein